MVVTAPRANQTQIETERAGTNAGLFRFSAGSSLLPNSALEYIRGFFLPASLRSVRQ
jgi:hypothetical protein